MRIGVDVHVLSGKFQGSRTYLLNLYKEIVSLDEANEYVFFGHWDNDYSPYGENNLYVDYKTKSRLKRLTYQSNPIVNQNKVQLFHSTYISPLLLSCKSLLTIHDILFENCTAVFFEKEVIRNKILVKLSAQRAKQIHTVSEYQKKQ